jgi:WD40 repeat protein/serine/threonine protein kinase
VPGPYLTHPTADQLRAFSLGRGSDDEQELIATHLDGCHECREVLDRLDSENLFLSHLQTAAAPGTEVQENEGQRRQAAHDAYYKRHRPGLGERDTWQGSVPAALDPACPCRVGKYDILAEVGRGGVGVVYKARHRGLQRLAALKMMLGGQFASPTELLRFQLEAELAARVQHPNIVQVYEVGTHEGRPFLAMEWVEGGTLAYGRDTWPRSPQEAAQLVETLARAVNAAHTQGVIHRDLKPANILLSREGDPKIADFGLARLVQGGGLTQTGLIVGTPEYMAPERASAGGRLAGTAADVYALGVILYELLTGRLPFRGKDPLEVLQAITTIDPVAPRRWQRCIPPDLEAVTLHCLEKEPGRRYASAGALADDLRRFQDGQPIVARSASTVTRLLRWCRRRPLIASLVTLVVVSFLTGFAGVTWQWREANEQRKLADRNAQEAERQKQEAERQKQEALRQAYRGRLAAATAALTNHDIVEAHKQLQAAPVGLKNWEWHYLTSRLDDSSVVVRPRPGSILRFTAGPEEFRLVELSQGRVRWLDEVGQESPVQPPSVPGQVRFVNSTRFGARLLIEGEDGLLRLLDNTGRQLLKLKRPSPQARLTALDVSADQARVAIYWLGDGPGRILLYDTATGKEQPSSLDQGEGLQALAISPDGSQVIAAFEHGMTHLWDTVTGKTTALLPGTQGKVTQVGFGPDGARVLTVERGGTVRQWDARTGQGVGFPLKGHAAEVLAAAYSPDGQWIASGGADRTVSLWRVTDGQELAVLHGHTRSVTRLVFSPDGRRLASACEAQEFRIWDLDAQQRLPVLRDHTGQVIVVAFTPDGRRLASAGLDDMIRLTDPTTGQPLKAWSAGHTCVHALAFPADGARLYSTGNDGKVRVWETATGRLQATWEAHTARVRKMVLSPDGTRVVTWFSADGTVRLWDTAIGREMGRLTDLVSEGHLGDVAFSPDGRLLATPDTHPHRVVLRDAVTLCAVVVLEGHTKSIASVAFHPDGKWVLTAGWDRTMRLWETATGAPIGMLTWPAGPLNTPGDMLTAVFSPDGTRIASGGLDRMLHLWDAEHQEEVAQLPGHANVLHSLVFSPDGHTLASGSADGTVRLWDTRPLADRRRGRHPAATSQPDPPP